MPRTRRTLSLLALVTVLSSIQLGSCGLFGSRAEAARKQLEARGLELDTADFLDAISGNDPATVELFLTAGIDPNAWDGERRELPLMVAAREADTEVVDLLLARGADPGRDPRILATPATLGRTRAVARLLAAGADPDARDKLGRTALIHTVDAGEVEVVRQLLAAGADVDAAGGRYPGMTPLFHATEGGHRELVEVLLAAGADPDVRGGRYQLTPLMLAAWTGDAAVARLLHAAGADPDIRNFRGDTASSLALRDENPEIIGLLTTSPSR